MAGWAGPRRRTERVGGPEAPRAREGGTKTGAAVRIGSSAPWLPPGDGVASVTVPGSTAALWRQVPRGDRSVSASLMRSAYARPRAVRPSIDVAEADQALAGERIPGAGACPAWLSAPGREPAPPARGPGAGSPYAPASAPPGPTANNGMSRPAFPSTGKRLACRTRSRIAARVPAVRERRRYGWWGRRRAGSRCRRPPWDEYGFGIPYGEILGELCPSGVRHRVHAAPMAHVMRIDLVSVLPPHVADLWSSSTRSV